MDEREKLEERLGHPRLREFTCNSLLRHSKNGVIIIFTNLNISDVNTKLYKEYESWLQNKKLEDSETNKEAFIKEWNRDCDNELYSYLKSSSNPYLFFPVLGGYSNRNGMDDSYERSFIVFNETTRDSQNKLKGSWQDVSWNNLIIKALEWCKEYKQDAVYIQPPNEAPYYYDEEGRQINLSSEEGFRFNDPNFRGFTTLKRKKINKQTGKEPKRFSAQIRFENMQKEDLRSLIESRIYRYRNISRSIVNKLKMIDTGEYFDEEEI